MKYYFLSALLATSAVAYGAVELAKLHEAIEEGNAIRVERMLEAQILSEQDKQELLEHAQKVVEKRQYESRFVLRSKADRWQALQGGARFAASVFGMYKCISMFVKEIQKPYGEEFPPKIIAGYLGGWGSFVALAFSVGPLYSGITKQAATLKKKAAENILKMITDNGQPAEQAQPTVEPVAK